MLLFVENKRIFAGLSVSRWGWLLHNAGLDTRDRRRMPKTSRRREKSFRKNEKKDLT